MSSQLRKMKRQKLREQYRKFQRAWDDEKMFQQYLIDSKGATVKEKDGQKYIIGDPSVSGQPLLGKKPTFSMWLQAKQNQTSVVQSQNEKKVEVEDLSWDEGG